MMSDISLLVARDLSVQLKHLPSHSHHVCVDAIKQPLLLRTSSASLVAKNDVSFSSTMSLLILVLGIRKWTVSPSSTCRNWHQGMREGFHLKSLSRTNSVVSISDQEKFPHAGLTKHSNIFLRG